ncbi:MAG: hypothetical protein KAW41_06700 [Candidatus Diapherotrites archaeon]|nr:hypothetical protein [Candidatus Diapherotrites archaeon]
MVEKVEKRREITSLYRRIGQHGKITHLQKALEEAKPERELAFLKFVDKHVGTIPEDHKPTICFHGLAKPLLTLEKDEDFDAVLFLVGKQLSSFPGDRKIDVIYGLEPMVGQLSKFQKTGRVSRMVRFLNTHLQSIPQENKERVLQTTPHTINSFMRLDEDLFPTALGIADKHFASVPDRNKASVFTSDLPKICDMLYGLYRK